MTTLNDARFEALRGLGYTGNTNDMMVQFLQGKGATSDSLPDAWREFLDLVVVSPTGQYNDDWNTYLGDQGHTGALNDRELAFWISQGVNLGADLVTNGTLDTDDTGWSGTFVWSGGAGNPPGSMFTLGAASLTQALTLTQGNTYRIGCEFGANGGNVTVSLGGTSAPGGPISGNGAFTRDIVAGAGSDLAFSSSAAVWVDNITCQEIL